MPLFLFQRGQGSAALWVKPRKSGIQPVQSLIGKPLDLKQGMAIGDQVLSRDVKESGTGQLLLAARTRSKFLNSKYNAAAGLKQQRMKPSPLEKSSHTLPYWDSL